MILKISKLADILVVTDIRYWHIEKKLYRIPIISISAIFRYIDPTPAYILYSPGGSTLGVKTPGFVTWELTKADTCLSYVERSAKCSWTSNFVKNREFFTCAPAMLWAGIVFGGVCVSVCTSVCLYVCLSVQNLENCWSEIDVTWLEHVP